VSLTPHRFSVRLLFVGSPYRHESLLTGAAPLDERSNATTGYGEVSGAAASRLWVGSILGLLKRQQLSPRSYAGQE